MFDKFKKKNELLDNEQNEEIEAPGWDAIDKLCDKVYPNQKNLVLRQEKGLIK